MSVSRGLKSLGEYVVESTGEDRVFALCVFTDAAMKEGTKEAELYCAELLSKHLSESHQDFEYEVGSEVFEAEKVAWKVTVDQLIEVAGRLDKKLDRETLIRMAQSAIKRLKIEEDRSVRTRLREFLVRLGVPASKIPGQGALFLMTSLGSLM